MSFDVYLQGFQNGEASEVDGAVLLELLQPFVTKRDGASARLNFDDGAADVHGLDQPASGLMVNRASGRAVWDLVYRVAAAVGLFVMPVGCAVCVVDSARVGDLPESLRGDTAVITSGADLLAVIAIG